MLLGYDKKTWPGCNTAPNMWYYWGGIHMYSNGIDFLIILVKQRSIFEGVERSDLFTCKLEVPPSKPKKGKSTKSTSPTVSTKVFSWCPKMPPSGLWWTDQRPYSVQMDKRIHLGMGTNWTAVSAHLCPLFSKELRLHPTIHPGSGLVLKNSGCKELWSAAEWQLLSTPASHWKHLTLKPS